MAKIRYFVKSKKQIGTIYMRFYHSNQFDLNAKTGFLINPKHWDSKNQRFKSISREIPDKELILNHLSDLRQYVVSEYNKGYIMGEAISGRWLQGKIDKFNNRPQNGQDYEVYFIPFVKKWIDDSANRVNIMSGKKINPRTIKKYNTTVARLDEYEQKYNVKLKHSDIDLDFHKKFVAQLVDANYSPNTIEKYISQIKTFCREAEANGFNISKQYKSNRFTFRKRKPLDPYLTIEEINKIFELEIDDEKLDKIRDLFIIGLWTGLRVSDFKEIDRLKIVGDDILIGETQKTSASTKIPIHPQIRKVLDKRNGKLPNFGISPKALENLFNKEIKEIVKNAGITHEIIGDLRDKEKNRNVRGIYPKYELVSSHICRRSFVTNHYGKLPNQAIMAITTHSSEKQLMEYVKISNDHYVEMVRQLWQKEESKLE